MSNTNFTMFIDGACPMCSREARFIKRLDNKNSIQIIDTSTPDFNAATYGISTDTDRLIHGKLKDGTIISGVAVFRNAYSEIGLGWLLAPTGWPILKPIFDKLYLIFAKNRKKIGRLFGPSCNDKCG